MHVTARLATVLLAALAISSFGCKPRETPTSESRMGDPAVAGSLTFNVVEAKWQSQLDAFPTARMPERNFLLLKVTVTNSGGSDTTVPFLKLENAQGESFPEIEDGTGVDGWLGVLRNIGPAQTEEGWIVFDVPTNTYKLRVVSGSDHDRYAYISIPLSMQTDMAAPRVP